MTVPVEYALLAETGAIKIPDHLSFEEAATLLRRCLTAWNVPDRDPLIKAGDRRHPSAPAGVSVWSGPCEDAWRLRSSHSSSDENCCWRCADALKITTALSQNGICSSSSKLVALA